MSDAHRYSEREIAAIFEQAANAQETAQAGLSSREGLSLSELQEIGSEVGILPEFIARAASTVVGTRATLKTTNVLGFPLTVERTIDLPGPLSDEDWDRLVVDLRETFRASGELRRQGELREWRDGNLHALVEPTDSGHRLRLSTTKGSAGRSLVGGSAFVAIGLIFLIIRLVTGDLAVDPDSLFVGMLAAAGLGMLGVTRYSLPRWAKRRGRQMEEVATRAVERMTAQSTDSIDERLVSPRLDLDSLPDIEDFEQDRELNRTRS